MKKIILSILASALHLGVFASTLPDMFYSFDLAATGNFYVYEKINDEGVYLQFKITHVVNAKINCNMWRVMDSYLVRYNGTSMTSFQQILTAGENEFVWRSSRPDVVDYTGGYHGDERIDLDPSSNVSFFADNVLISIKRSIPLTVCGSFYYIQNSTMHQTGTGGTDSSNPAYKAPAGNPIDCFHEKRTVFQEKGYVCFNKVNWNADVPIDHCFYGIFCVNKDISSKGSNERGDTVTFTSGADGKAWKLKSEKQQIKYWNSTLGTSVVCNSSIVSLPFSPGLNTQVWDISGYHKYYSRITSTNARKGDEWNTKSWISFNYKNPSG